MQSNHSIISINKLHSFRVFSVFLLISFIIFSTKNSDRTLLFFYALDLMYIISYGKAGYIDVFDNFLQCSVFFAAIIIITMIGVPEAWMLFIRFQKTDNQSIVPFKWHFVIHIYAVKDDILAEHFDENVCNFYTFIQFCSCLNYKVIFD